MFTLKNNKLVRVAVTTIFLVAGGAFGIALISRIDEVIMAEGIILLKRLTRICISKYMFFYI